MGPLDLDVKWISSGTGPESWIHLHQNNLACIYQVVTMMVICRILVKYAADNNLYREIYSIDYIGSRLLAPSLHKLFYWWPLIGSNKYNRMNKIRLRESLFSPHLSYINGNRGLWLV